MPAHDQTSRRITFVGAGAIGLPMARRLAAAHDVTVVDPVPTVWERAESEGLAAVADVGQAPPADLGVVVVATPDQLTAVVDAVLELDRPTTWVVMSTVGPDSCRREAVRLEDAGHRVLDAPVTGGVAGAERGALTLFASGDPAVLAECTPALSLLGTVRQVGERVGDGQAVKVVNQHLCSIHIVAAAEALHLAASLGLDPAEVLDLVRDGAAGSWMLADRGPRMLQGRDAEVTSAIDIFVKDSGLVADAAAGSATDVPLLDLARERYLRAADLGLGRADDSQVIATYEAQPEEAR